MMAAINRLLALWCAAPSRWFARWGDRPMNTSRKKAPTPSTAPGAYGEQLSFLPPAPFCPIWPARGTLAARALGMMLDGRSINHPDFENVTQSWRLGAVVHQLRTLGWPVKTIETEAPTDDCPGRIIALYCLAGERTAAALALSEGG